MLSGIFSREQLFQRQKRKGFLHLIVTGDEKWIHYNESKRRISWGKTTHQHRRQSRISMIRNFGSAFGGIKCSLLRAAQTERNHHGRSLSIDAFELSIEGKRAAIRAET